MTSSASARPKVELRGAHDDASLTFEAVRETPYGTSFCSTFKKGSFCGVVQASTYLVGPPSVLFAEMARDWRGWRGRKEWRDLDNVLSLTATSDSTGHSTLLVEMRSDNLECTSLVSNLVLEAGSLERIATDVAQIFGDDTSLNVVKRLSETEK